jgi:hypothetical protein
MEFGLILKHHLGIMKNQFLETLYSRFLPSEFIYSQHLAALLKIPEAHVKTMLLHELGDGQLTLYSVPQVFGRVYETHALLGGCD